MKETAAQINGLRAAFSADLSRPFELKRSFPLGSPPEHFRASPPARQPSSQQIMIPSQNYIRQHMDSMQQQQQSYLATPPVSAISSESKPQSPRYQQDYVDHSSYPTMPPTSYPQQTIPAESQWNPTPIIDQFNTAFAIPPSQLAPPPTGHSPYGSSPPHEIPQQTYYPQNQPQYSPAVYSQQHQQQQQQQQQQNYMQTPQYTDSTIASQPIPQATPTYIPQAAVFVTPKQWQQSVASVFDPGGLKRRWGYEQQDQSGYDMQMQKRRG